MHTPSRSEFVPKGFDGSSWAAIEPLLEQLKSREVPDRAAMDRWLLDKSEFDAACAEAKANLHIATTQNTEDKGVETAYARYIEGVVPRLQKASFDLDRRLVEISGRMKLPPDRFGVLERGKRSDVAIYREENVPIKTDLMKQAQEFAKVAGKQMVLFEGQERTMPQMMQFMQSTDRAQREAAWRATAARRMQDKGTLDALYDKMIAARHKVAVNAGCKGYVEFAFKEMHRFDYTAKDCEAYWGAVEKHVVPLVRRLDAERKRDLKVDPLRPWDLDVDVHGRERLRPFEGGRDLLSKTVATMDALDPRLGRMLRRMGDPAALKESGERGLVTEYLDLDSRKGKRPGGYQYMRDFTRRPFIFMNAAGLHRDVMTMVHEAGHAFHSMLSEDEPLVDYRHSPIEFAEVASMSMEHLTMPHWTARGGFYSSEGDAARARREHLETSIGILAWIATIDAFQHWVYANPGHTSAQRDDRWVSLDERFGHAVSWQGLEPERRNWWQKQPHLFSYPLYYIEYGIAQLGALSLWVKSRNEGERAAVDAYVRALSLGGSKPLPQLFGAAGLEFDFGERTVARVVEAVEGELETMRAS